MDDVLTLSPGWGSWLFGGTTSNSNSNSNSPRVTVTSSFFGFGSVLPRIHTDTKNTYPFFSLLGEKGMFLFFWLFAAFLFFNVVAFFGRFRAEFCGPRSVHGAFQFLAVGPSTSFRSQGTPSPIGPLFSLDRTCTHTTRKSRLLD